MHQLLLCCDVVTMRVSLIFNYCNPQSLARYDVIVVRTVAYGHGYLPVDSKTRCLQSLSGELLIKCALGFLFRMLKLPTSAQWMDFQITFLHFAIFHLCHFPPAFLKIAFKPTLWLLLICTLMFLTVWLLKLLLLALQVFTHEQHEPEWCFIDGSRPAG